MRGLWAKWRTWSWTERGLFVVLGVPVFSVLCAVRAVGWLLGRAVGASAQPTHVLPDGSVRWLLWPPEPWTPHDAMWPVTWVTLVQTCDGESGRRLGPVTREGDPLAQFGFYIDRDLKGAEADASVMRRALLWGHRPDWRAHTAGLHAELDRLGRTLGDR